MAVISFNSYKITIVELETSLVDLPYISEAFVVGAPDYEVNEIAAAIIRLQKPYQLLVADDGTKSSAGGREGVTLRRIREDLLATLPAYKLPRPLRILSDEEDVPRTRSDKVIKKYLLKLYFNVSEFVSPEYSEPGVEIGEVKRRTLFRCGRGIGLGSSVRVRRSLAKKRHRTKEI